MRRRRPSPQRRRGKVALAVLLLACGTGVVGVAATTAGPAAETVASASASSAIITSDLLGVTATATNNAWAVGYRWNGSAHTAIIDHWNGKAWAQVAAPNPGYRGSTLDAVAATSATNAWAVGEQGLKPIGAAALIEHWNGRSWSVQRCPSPASGPVNLYGVAALSASNAWAVGTYAGAGGTLIEHWNGRAWSIQPSPSPAGTVYLLAVAALSASNAWAVGQVYSTDGTSHNLVDHWDGHRWSTQKSVDEGYNYNRLNGVSAAAGTAWVTGATEVTNSAYAEQGDIEKYGSQGWRAQSPGILTASQYMLNAIRMVSGSAGWAVGSADIPTRAGTSALIEHWNGKTWSVQPNPSPVLDPPPNPTLSTPDVRLFAVTVLSGTSAWAVGWSGNYQTGGSKTLIEYWNGRAWRLQPSPSPGS